MAKGLTLDIAANTREAGPLPVRAVAAVGRKPAAEPEIGVPRSTVSGYLETTRTPPVESHWSPTSSTWSPARPGRAGCSSSCWR